MTISSSSNQQSSQNPASRVPYEKPALERFGTFRELTSSGRTGAGDACMVFNPDLGQDGDERCYDE